MVLGFKKPELIFVIVTLFVIAGVTKLNLIDSYRKSRDVTRKDSLGDVMNRLEKFKERLGFYPEGTNDGKILGCNGFLNMKSEWIFEACNWGKNEINSPYFSDLPVDPKAEDGYQYYYVSTGESYQLLAPIEGSREDEYDPKIVLRNIKCGTAICSSGRSNLNKESLRVPLPTPKNVIF